MKGAAASAHAGCAAKSLCGKLLCGMLAVRQAAVRQAGCAASWLCGVVQFGQPLLRGVKSLRLAAAALGGGDGPQQALRRLLLLPVGLAQVGNR